MRRVEAVGIVVVAVVAVASWFANGYLTRRATRRQSRVEYLLSAYRRLDTASNRELTVTSEADLESAISDIQLLGTPRQVRLAEDLAREFATQRSADTGPLLEDLRSTLRKELLLEGVPERAIWLRITRDGGWAQESAFVRGRVGELPAGAQRREETADFQLGDVAVSDPLAAVLAAFGKVEARLQERLSSVVPDARQQNFENLLEAGGSRGLLSGATVEAVNGLAVMRNLAAHARRPPTEGEAREFLALVDAVLFAISRELPPNPRVNDA